MMMACFAFCILFSIAVTLTERYWVTSDERRRTPAEREQKSECKVLR